MSNAWDRQPGESTKAYAAFCAYRDLGPERSIEKAGQMLDKPRSKKWLGEWSSKYHWVERARAYDDYIEMKKRVEHEQAILEMAERQARIAMAFQEKIIERLQSIDPAELTPTELARWFDVAAKIERLNRGEPTEIGKQEVTLPQILEVELDADAD